MFGYLIYDTKDIIRNESFIQWFLQVSQDYGIPLKLYNHQEDFSRLPKPCYVINRSRKKQISYYYEDQSIPVFNKARVTEIANDKLKTYDQFKDYFPMIETNIFTGGENYPYVVKERFGHGGDQVYLVKNKADIKDFFYSKNYIQQALGDQPGKDLRVYILNNQIIASVLRSHPTDFRSNYSLGGNIELYPLNAREIKAVNKILEILPLDYGGIDFLFDKKDQLILNEIEDVVGARMLYNLKQTPIVEMYLSHIKKSITNL